MQVLNKQQVDRIVMDRGNISRILTRMSCFKFKRQTFVPALNSLAIPPTQAGPAAPASVVGESADTGVSTQNNFELVLFALGASLCLNRARVLEACRARRWGNHFWSSGSPVI
jgi:hypothetical protein